MNVEARLLLTCEHGGHRVPARYRARFESRAARRALESHRGWDPGALDVGRRMAVHLGASLFSSRVSRLLVDLNRSVNHPKLFSEFLVSIPDEEKEDVLKRYYWPHRRRVERAVEQLSGAWHPTVHVAVHSFTPRMARRPRRADIGLLYDPSRPLETELCARWKLAIQAAHPHLRVRRNYPYRGVADGFPTALRRRFASCAYTGIELELNQAWLMASRDDRRFASKVLARTLRSALDGLQYPPVNGRT